MYDSNELILTDCPCPQCIVLAACKRKELAELLTCSLLHDYLYTEGGQGGLDVICLGILCDIMDIKIVSDGFRISLKYKDGRK